MAELPQSTLAALKQVRKESNLANCKVSAEDLNTLRIDGLIYTVELPDGSEHAHVLPKFLPLIERTS